MGSSLVATEEAPVSTEAPAATGEVPASAETPAATGEEYVTKKASSAEKPTAT